MLNCSTALLLSPTRPICHCSTIQPDWILIRRWSLLKFPQCAAFPSSLFSCGSANPTPIVLLMFACHATLLPWITQKMADPNWPYSRQQKSCMMARKIFSLEKTEIQVDQNKASIHKLLLLLGSIYMLAYGNIMMHYVAIRRTTVT